MNPLFDRPQLASIRRRELMIAASAITAGSITGTSFAQNVYPNKPIRVVIPYPPGGPTDIVGRIVTQALSERLKQPITVENKAGASGMIGADIVAKASADGYTLLINVSGQIVNPSLYAKMPHDPIKDFTPITNLARTPIVLVTSANNTKIQTFQDLLNAIRTSKASFASSSNGTPGHLMGELFKELANLDATHVPYKGAAPALTDVIGGQVLYMFDSLPSSISLIKGGKLRPLGVSAPKRVDVLPDVPTFSELNFSSLNLTTWYGMWGPAKMPAELAEQIQREVAQVLANPDVRKRLSDAMLDPIGDSPANFKVYQDAEAKRYTAIIKAAGIKLE